MFVCDCDGVISDDHYHFMFHGYSHRNYVTKHFWYVTNYFKGKYE